MQPHDRIIAEVAKNMLVTEGLFRKGRSRVWLEFTEYRDDLSFQAAMEKYAHYAKKKVRKLRKFQDFDYARKKLQRIICRKDTDSFCWEMYDLAMLSFLLGDFSVGTPGVWSPLERSAVRYQGEFTLQKPKKTLSAENLQQQGYPFFCGKLVLEGSLDIQGEDPVLLFKRKGVNVIKVEIAGKEQALLTDDRLPLKPFGPKGLTTVRYTLINNLRNLLGPHHLSQGESYGVCPRHFFKEPCVWNNGSEQSWDENYCFVEFGF